MNKFLMFGLLAFTSYLVVVSAGDFQRATDEQEVAQLKDKSSLFADFCLAARDYISHDLQAKGKSLVPNTVLDLLNDTANRHKNIRARLDSILRDPATELRKFDGYVAQQQKYLAQLVQDHPIQASELYDRARNAGQRVRGFLNNPASHLQKLDGFFARQQKALGERIQSNPIQPVNFFKQAYDSLQSMGNRIRAAPGALLNETCNTFEQYQTEIVRRFEVTKEELKMKDSEVSSLELKDVPCLTMSRVNAVLESCADLRGQ